MIFDSVSFIFLWRRYASKCQRVKQSCLYLPQRRLDSSSQTIMGRIIEELSYNETVELDGSPWSTSFVDFSHNCSRTQNIFTQNVYSIKDVINVSWLSGWDTFKTCMIFGVVESWACKLQIKPPVSKNCGCTPFQTPNVIANTLSTDRLRFQLMVNSVMG